jgi:hypothetical protein
MKVRFLNCRAVPAILLALAMVATSSQSPAGSKLEDILRQQSLSNVAGYIQPMADSFGANMNAGLYNSADVPETGLHFAVDIVGMVSMVSDDQKSYTAQAPANFTPSTFKTATIFGDKGSTVTDANNPGLSYKGSDGIISATMFPLAVPQLTIGSIYGTEAVIRFITTPSIGDDKFPKTTLFGIGGRHNIARYVPELGFDISANIFYNKFTVGDLIDFNSFAIGAAAGKSFSILSVYGGLQYEKSSMNLKFTSANATSSSAAVDMSLDGANNFRFLAGLKLQLAIFRIFANANFGSVTNFSGGIGFGG